MGGPPPPCFFRRTNKGDLKERCLPFLSGYPCLSLQSPSLVESSLVPVNFQIIPCFSCLHWPSTGPLRFCTPPNFSGLSMSTHASSFPTLRPRLPNLCSYLQDELFSSSRAISFFPPTCRTSPSLPPPRGFAVHSRLVTSRPSSFLTAVRRFDIVESPPKLFG